VIENAGKYRAQAREWSLGKAGTGNPQVGVMFDLLDHEGEQLTWYGSFTDAALPTTVKALQAMGWQGADIRELAQPTTKLDQEVVLVVEWDEYNGKRSLKVKWVNSMGGLAMKEPLAGSDLDAFAAALRGKILALDPSSAAKRAAAPRATATSRPTPPAHRDEDIPF
jgi:hypothetical protein